MKTGLKLLFMLLALTLVLFAFASCDNGGEQNGGENSGENGGNTNNPADDADEIKGTIIFAPGVSPTLIKSSIINPSSPDQVFDWLGLSEAISAYTGAAVLMNSDKSAISGPEIVVGDTYRDVSVKAFEKLEAKIARTRLEFEDAGKDTKYITGFAIYAEGGCVALVYDTKNVVPLAYEYFIENFINASTLALEDGYCITKVFSLLELYESEEEAAREAKYAEIAEKFSPAVATAIRNHLSQFGDNYYLWLADLYDPGEYDEEGKPLGGGFYFSNSARDTAGFGIDIESTMQILSFLQNSGMAKNEAQIRETFPEEIQKQLIAFARNLQSPVDGYFYHPQWGTNITTSRKGRDLGWATSTLSLFNAKPYWNAPNGTTGLYGEPPGEEPVTAMSAPLAGRSSVVSAVSTVVPASRKWNGSSWLATLDAWEEYILSYEPEIRTKSYSIGNNFAAQSAQIKSRDAIGMENEELVDADGDGIADGGFIEMWEYYFNLWQLDYNGLWEHNKTKNANGEVVDDPNGEYYYNQINGLMKISSVYNSLSIKFNYADRAFLAAAYMCTYLGDGENWADVKGKGPTGSVDVYNPFVSMSALISNVNRHGSAEESEALRSIITAKALDVVTTTTTKISKFRKPDGTYGYNWGAVGSSSQGALVAVAGTIEGDVNGGNIAFTGTYNNMCSALGISGLKPFGYSDLIKFSDRIAELEHVTKDTTVVTTDPITFDDEAPGKVELNGYSEDVGGGSATIIEDPTGSGKGNVLEVVSVGNDGDKGCAVTFNAGGANNANCNVLEFDLYLAEVLDYTTIFQIRVCDGYLLTIKTAKDGTYTLGDASSTGSGSINTKFDAVFQQKEWNSFRIEFYMLEGSDTMTKIYANDKLVGLSNNYFDKQKGTAPTLKFASTRFYMLYSIDCTALFDNIYGYQTTKAYVEEQVVNPNRVKDFDSVAAGGTKLPTGVTTSGGSVVNDPTEANPNNNALLLDAKGETLNVALSSSVPKTNASALYTKMKIDANASGKIGTINLAFDSNNPIVAYDVTVYTSDGEKYARLTEINKEGKSGKSFDGIPVGEWFELGIEFYTYQYDLSENSIIYLNGAPIGYGSLIYNINTVAKEYTAFVYVSTAKASVYFDDIIVETINKLFVGSDGVSIETPDIELPAGGKPSETPAGADHDGRFDFEDSAIGVPAIPGLKTTPATKDVGNSITVELDPTNAANKVLKQKAASTTKDAGNTSVFTASKKIESGANCYVFSFDMLVGYFSKGGIQTSIKGTGGTNLFQTNTYVSGNWIDGSGTMAIKSKYKPTADSAEVSTEVILDYIKVSGWVNVRYELYIDQGLVKIYYDNILRAETEFVNKYLLSNAYESANIYTTYGTGIDLYIDNVIVEAISKEYKSETIADTSLKAGDGWDKPSTPEGGNTPSEPEGGDTPSTPSTPETPPVIETPEIALPEDYSASFDFESEQTATFYIPGLNATLNNGYVLVMEGDSDENTRVLAFNSSKNSYDTLEITTLPLSAGTKAASLFKFDFYVDYADAAGVLYYVDLGGSYVLTINATADGKITIGDAMSVSTTTSRQTLVSGLSKNTWYTVTVEYAVVNGVGMAKIYLGDELVAVSDNSAKASSNDAPKWDYKKVTITSPDSIDVLAYFDNITAVESDSFEAAKYTHELVHLGKYYTYTPSGSVYEFEDGVSNNSDFKQTAKGVAYSITDDPKDASNRVLVANITSEATDSNALLTTIKTNNGSDETNTNGDYLQRYGYYVFSYDVLYDGLETPTKDTLIQEFIFRTESYWNHMRLYYTANGTFYFTHCNTGLKDENGDYIAGKGATYATGIDLNDGEWHNVRIVINKRGYESTLSLFIDDLCVADSIASYYSEINADYNYKIKDIMFRQKKGDYDVYLDNIYLEYAGEINPFANTK